MTSEPILKTSRTKNGISQIDGYLKMLLKQQQEQVSTLCEDLAETKFKKINVYLHGETGVGKTKLARNSKAVREKKLI